MTAFFRLFTLMTLLCAHAHAAQYCPSLHSNLSEMLDGPDLASAENLIKDFETQSKARNVKDASRVAQELAEHMRSMGVDVVEKDSFVEILANDKSRLNRMVMSLRKEVLIEGEMQSRLPLLKVGVDVRGLIKDGANGFFSPSRGILCLSFKETALNVVKGTGVHEIFHTHILQQMLNKNNLILHNTISFEKFTSRPAVVTKAAVKRAYYNDIDKVVMSNYGSYQSIDELGAWGLTATKLSGELNRDFYRIIEKRLNEILDKMDGSAKQAEASKYLKVKIDSLFDSRLLRAESNLDVQTKAFLDGQLEEMLKTPLANLNSSETQEKISHLVRRLVSARSLNASTQEATLNALSALEKKPNKLIYTFTSNNAPGSSIATVEIPISGYEYVGKSTEENVFRNLDNWKEVNDASHYSVKLADDESFKSVGKLRRRDVESINKKVKARLESVLSLTQEIEKAHQQFPLLNKSSAEIMKEITIRDFFDLRKLSTDLRSLTRVPGVGK